jgi:hypothetical protein
MKVVDCLRQTHARMQARQILFLVETVHAVSPDNLGTTLLALNTIKDANKIGNLEAWSRKTEHKTVLMAIQKAIQTLTTNW